MLKKMKVSKSSGLDKISSRLLKQLGTPQLNHLRTYLILS